MTQETASNLVQHRVVVVGTSGCGKSTFARQLAARIDAPHIELDSLYWLRDWQPRDAEEFQTTVTRRVADPTWVVDGNYSSVRSIVWPRATHIIWLNYSRPRVIWQILKRTWRRARTQEKVCGDNVEQWRTSFFSTDSVILWSLRTFASNRRTYTALLASPPWPHLHCLSLHHPRQASTLLSHSPHSLKMESDSIFREWATKAVW